MWSLIFLLILWLIGLGPAVLIHHKKRPLIAISASPVWGSMILLFLSFPLYRYIAPSRVWAWPIIVALVGGSLWLFRRCAKDHWLSSRKECLLVLSCVLIPVLFLYSILSWPNRTVNPEIHLLGSGASDVFLYSAFADMSSAADFELVNRVNRSGIASSHGKQLVEEDPTALYVARLVAKPLIVSVMVFQGIPRSLFGVPSIYLFAEMKNIGFILLYCSLIPLWSLLRVPIWLGSLSGLGTCLGFWAAVTAHYDFLSQLVVYPAAMVCLYHLVDLIEQSSTTSYKPILVTGFAAATVACSYTVFIPILVCLAFVQLSVSALLAGQLLRKCLAALYASGVAVFLLWGSGQYHYIVDSIIFSIKLGNAFVGHTNWVISSIFLRALPSLAGALMLQHPSFDALAAPYVIYLEPVYHTGSVFFAATLLLSIALSTLLARRENCRVLLSMWLGFGLFAYSFVLPRSDAPYSLLKGMVILAPIGIVLVTGLYGVFADRKDGIGYFLKALVIIIVVNWCCIQLTTRAIVYHLMQRDIALIDRGTNFQVFDFKIRSFHKALREAGKDAFVAYDVAEENENSWIPSFFYLLALKDHIAHICSGYPFDNEKGSLLTHPNSSCRNADYLIVGKNVHDPDLDLSRYEILKRTSFLWLLKRKQ